MPFEEILFDHLNYFRDLDHDGVPGISARDADIIVGTWLSEVRSREVGTMLSRDLDGDQQVTEEELRTVLFVNARASLRNRNVGVEPTEEQIEEQLSRIVEAELEYDLDGNRILTVGEVYQFHDSRFAEFKEYRDVRERRSHFPSTSLDTNRDGTVSQGEYAGFVELTLSTIDADGDGVATQDEHSNFLALLQDLLDARAD